MATVDVLDFKIWKILTVRTVKRVKLLQCTSVPNFVAISHRHAEIWRFFFDFSKMAAIRHHGFVMRLFGPPTKGIWWSLSLCKIWL